jgi:hypothetical protein
MERTNRKHNSPNPARNVTGADTLYAVEYRATKLAIADEMDAAYTTIPRKHNTKEVDARAVAVRGWSNEDPAQQHALRAQEPVPSCWRIMSCASDRYSRRVYPIELTRLSIVKMRRRVKIACMNPEAIYIVPNAAQTLSAKLPPHTLENRLPQVS